MRRRFLSNPLEQYALLLIIELPARMDEIVIAGRHRAISYHFADRFEFRALSL
jgi:hypothetical protein